MPVAKVIEIVAASKTSWDDAVKTGLERANQTLKGLTGLEIISKKAKVEDGKITEYRVHMKITFILQ
ncbi:MAG: dodecin family protein [Nitrospirota bacterium]